MNTQQKIQIGLGVFLILGGVGTSFFNPIIGGLAINTGIAVAGFSNTVTSALKSIFGKSDTTQTPVAK